MWVILPTMFVCVAFNHTLKIKEPPPLFPLPLLKVNKMLLTKKEEIMKQLHVIFS